MLAALTEGYGNPSSLHAQGTRAAEAVAQARARLARLVGRARARSCSPPAAPKAIRRRSSPPRTRAARVGAS
jgi:hypothetical protein